MLLFAPICTSMVQQSFSLSDLSATAEGSVSQEVAKTIMDRFLQTAFDGQVLRATWPEQTEIPEISFNCWTSSLSDRRRITWYPNSGLSVWGNDAKALASHSEPLTVPLAREKALSMARKLQIPSEWSIVDDPEVCDFADFNHPDPYRFVIGILPPGFRYPHPTKRLTMVFDQASGQIKCIGLANHGDSPDQVKLTKAEAIQRAKQFARPYVGPSEIVPYEDQIGLGYGFSDELRTKVRTAYVVPFHFRLVVNVDAMTGDCLEVICYK